LPEKLRLFPILARFQIFLYALSMSKNEHRIVWSSKHGDLRKKENKHPPVKSLPPQQQIVHLHRESKGRGGKTVTLVKNLILSDADLKSLAKRLKQACGSGGTVKDGMIEIQGEHREKIAATLRKMGYKAKIAGG
jgi:translation initiation factor 1